MLAVFFAMLFHLYRLGALKEDLRDVKVKMDQVVSSLQMELLMRIEDRARQRHKHEPEDQPANPERPAWCDNEEIVGRYKIENDSP
jgi:hypothetical protein